MTSLAPMRTGALGVLAACFVASAVFRAGDVLAEDPTLASGLRQAREAFSRGLDAGVVEESRMKRDLEERAATLDAREAALAERAERLAALDAELRARLATLKEQRDRLKAELDTVDDAAEADIAHLAGIYAQMKPKRAGTLFETMAPGFAAGFLAEMAPTAAAAVLAEMSAERAYAVSVLMAGRRAQVAGGGS